MLIYIYLLIQISSQSPQTYGLPSHLKIEPAKQVIGMTSKEVVEQELLKTEWQYLRVTHDYLQSTPDPKYQAFVEKVTSIVETFLAKHLLVRRAKEPLKFQDGWSTEWYGFEISEHLQQKEYDADLVFFINIENVVGENYIAYASPQYGDVEYSNRPIFGIASFNMAYINITNPSTVKFESFVQTVLHEYIHGMGFQKEMVEHFYDSATGFSYQKAAYELEGAFHISTPRLLNFARIYFDCEELDGLKMENQGGLGTEGSHFDRVLVGKELMTGSDIVGDVLVTDFTFQFLQDTGYYRVAEYNPDQNMWGYKKGCGFIEEMCYGDEEFPEFCKNINSIGCSYDRGGVAICTDRDPLADGCKYNYIEPSFDCRDATLQSQSYSYYQYFGYNSMCIDGYLSQSGVNPFASTCYQYQCTYDGKLSIIVNNMTFSCANGQEITTPKGYIGHLKCPENPEEFCQGDNECPNQCNYRGFCMRGLCTCLIGYSGLGCESTCLGYRRLSRCVSQCPAGTFILEEYKYCISCPGNCKVCSQYNQCEECNEGFKLHGGFCDYEYEEYAFLLGIFVLILI